MRLPYLLIDFILLQIHLDLPSRQKTYLKIKVFNKIQFFTVEFIHTCDDLISFCFNYLCKFHLIPKLKRINNKSFLRILLLLSGDISLNPGPVYNNQSLHSNEGNVFRSKGIHLIHLNVNSLLPKIDEIRYIAERTKAAVIGKSESKLDESIFQSEIQIDNYDLLRCDRNRNGGGVACYIRSDISYVQKDFFPNVIENIFFEILLPKTSPITVSIMYRPPSQTNFLEILNMTFEKVDVDKKEIYILGDFNINMYHNNRYIVRDGNTISSKFLSHDIKNYHQFCTMHGLKQLIQSPTRVTCSTSTLIDHILTSAPSRVSQKGVINVGVSDHQLIFCTRKISRIKTGGDHKYLNFRSLKNYTADYYKETLKQVDFPNYENFGDVNEAYSNFFQKLMTVIDKIAPYKSKRVKGNTQKWFDGEVLEKLNLRNKLFKKFKKSRLHIDKELYKKSKYDALKLIAPKKQACFEEKLSETIGKPKELWESLKSLGMPKRTVISNFNAIEENDTLTYDTRSISKIFKNFFSNLAKSLLIKLPNPPDKYNLQSVLRYYSSFTISDYFCLSNTSEEKVLKIMTNIESSKAAGVDKLSGRFLKDGANILAKPISALCNLSISQGVFPSACKVAKLKPIFKKGKKTDPSNYRPISLLPSISKIIERVIHDQTNAFLSDEDILYNYQSGFRGNHSTNLCLSFLTDKILKGFDEGLLTGMVLLIYRRHLTL